MRCPLCGTLCKTAKDKGGILPPSYRCPTIVVTGGDGGRHQTRSHYQKYQTGGWSTGMYYVEEAIVLPYMIESHHNDNTTIRTEADGTERKIVHVPHSAIYVMGPNPKYKPGPRGKGPRDVNKTAFVYTLRTPFVHMDIEDKLKQRIKLILLLS